MPFGYILIVVVLVVSLLCLLSLYYYDSFPKYFFSCSLFACLFVCLFACFWCLCDVFRGPQAPQLSGLYQGPLHFPFWNLPSCPVVPFFFSIFLGEGFFYTASCPVVPFFVIFFGEGFRFLESQPTKKGCPLFPTPNPGI